MDVAPETIRCLKTILKRFYLCIFKVMARLRLNVSPVDYYSVIPDVIRLARTVPRWNLPSVLPGITIDLEEQLRTLNNVCLPFQKEFLGNPHYLKGASLSYGPGFGYIEAQALHAVIRYLKPRRIIEVGGGVSTYCMLQALKLNSNEGVGAEKFLCIEPNPRKDLRNSRDVDLLEQFVEYVPVSRFECLSEGDFLFIDSSHAVKAVSDVNFLILEVLPRLQPGVWVHVHDIYFPYDYPRDLLQNFIFHNETSLLRAFLIDNPRAEILFCLSHLHYERQNQLRKIFPDYDPQPDNGGLLTADRSPFAQEDRHFPSSIYIRTQ